MRLFDWMYRRWQPIVAVVWLNCEHAFACRYSEKTTSRVYIIRRAKKENNEDVCTCRLLQYRSNISLPFHAGHEKNKTGRNGEEFNLIRAITERVYISLIDSEKKKIERKRLVFL
jgi:hypothetical protein